MCLQFLIEDKIERVLNEPLSLSYSEDLLKRPDEERVERRCRYRPGKTLTEKRGRTGQVCRSDFDFIKLTSK